MVSYPMLIYVLIRRWIRWPLESLEVDLGNEVPLKYLSICMFCKFSSISIALELFWYCEIHYACGNVYCIVIAIHRAVNIIPAQTWAHNSGWARLFPPPSAHISRHKRTAATFVSVWLSSLNMDTTIKLVRTSEGRVQKNCFFLRNYS